MGKLDLSKFKKVRSSEKHTVLRHPEGHEITIFHKALSKPVKAELDKLEMAEGGTAGNPKLQQAYKKPDKEQALEAKQRQEQMPAVQHFAKGGPVTDPDTVNAIRTSVGGKPTPSPTPPDNSTVEPKYDSNEDPKRKDVRASYGYANGGPVDMSHAHLSEAVKHLAQKFAGGSMDDNGDPAPVEQQFNMTAPENLSVPLVAKASAPMESGGGMNPTDPAVPESPISPAPTGTLYEQSQKNTEAANKAEMGAAQNTQAAQQQEANIYGKQAQSMADLGTKYEQSMDDMHSKFNSVASQVEKGHIDPNHWWSSKSTGSQVLTAIGMMFGGAVGGIGGHPEMASNAINAAIDRDIDAQKADLNNKHTLLGKYMDMYRSLPEAEAATRLTMNAAVEGKIKATAAKLGSQNAVLAAQQAIAGRRMGLTKDAQTLTQGQLMMDSMKGMNQPQHGGNEEDALKANIDRTRQMAAFNPALKERAQEIEDRYLPGIGVTRVAVPPSSSLRPKIASQRDLSNKLALLEQFAKEHGGMKSILDPVAREKGATMAANAQSALRVAQDQGVFKAADQKFIEGMIHGDPTAFLGQYRTIPKYQQIRKDNDDSLKSTYDSLGLKPFSGSSQPQPGGTQTRTINGKQYTATPQGWKPVK